MPYTTPENLAASEYDLDEESNGPFWNEASFYDCDPSAFYCDLSDRC